jgi:hypothetical protein
VGRKDNPFLTAADVASGLQWLRWKTQGGEQQSRRGALLILAYSPNSIAVSMDPKLDPEDAIEMLAAEADTVARLLRHLRASSKTHHFAARPDR